MIMTHDTSNNGSNSVCGTKTCLPKSANPSFTHENKTKIYSYIYIYRCICMHSDHLRMTSNHPWVFHWSSLHPSDFFHWHHREAPASAAPCAPGPASPWTSVPTGPGTTGCGATHCTAGGWPPKKIGTCGIWVLSWWKYYIGYRWWIYDDIWWICDGYMIPGYGMCWRFQF